MLCAECVPGENTNHHKKLLEEGGGRDDLAEEAMIEMNPARGFRLGRAKRRQAILGRIQSQSKNERQDRAECVSKKKIPRL